MCARLATRRVRRGNDIRASMCVEYELQRIYRRTAACTQAAPLRLAMGLLAANLGTGEVAFQVRVPFEQLGMSMALDRC